MYYYIVTYEAHLAVVIIYDVLTRGTEIRIYII